MSKFCENNFIRNVPDEYYLGLVTGRPSCGGDIIAMAADDAPLEKAVARRRCIRRKTSRAVADGPIGSM